MIIQADMIGIQADRAGKNWRLNDMIPDYSRGHVRTGNVCWDVALVLRGVGRAT